MGEDGQQIDVLANAVTPLAMEVAKAAAGGVTTGIRETSAEIWGALIGDRVKLWRTRNWVNGLEKTAAHISRKGIKLSQAKPLPYGEMLALFDGISKEDNEDLSDMWARLLAESMTEEGGPSLPARSVAAVLSQMGPDSARAFLLLAKECKHDLLIDNLGKIQLEEMHSGSDTEVSQQQRDLRHAIEKVADELEAEWWEATTQNPLSQARMEIAKGELIRLNLISRKKVRVQFLDSPFRIGYRLNAEGLDTVLGNLQSRIRDLVESRTTSSEPLVEARGDRSTKSNYQVSISGREIARKLGLLYFHCPKTLM